MTKRRETVKIKKIRNTKKNVESRRSKNALWQGSSNKGVTLRIQPVQSLEKVHYH